MDDARFLTGQFLLALPGIGDPRFERAVIAMCAHDEAGAMGVNIGARLDGIRLHGLLEQLDIDPGETQDAAIHFGGPVEPQRGFVVHSTDWDGQDTVTVADRWALSGTLDILKAIAAGTGPRQWLVALGYTGWASGQLDEEMTRHGWLNVSGSTDLLFTTPEEVRWESGYESAGIDPRMLATRAGTA